ncbi:cytochrome c oxidase assembly protein [Alphaproteobacteria bacterium]|nr:cytochrome c oxidase assembly protein [Alphaproteobacteria bacterium]
MHRGKGITVVCLLTFLGVMGTLTAYSVELYEVFCRATGYGGTTQIAERPSDRIVDRRITIRFNADTIGDLPWRFEPVHGAITIRAGQRVLAFYRVESNADKPVVGTATFNVTPSKAGRYFNKIDCFCFSEQTLDPGQITDLPVQFFVDPAIVDDPNLDDVTSITLSYTFFKAPDRGARMEKMASPRNVTFPIASTVDGRHAVN